MSKPSITDTSRPNAGRIYDYLLGGHHNFEVDRQAAEQIRALLPFIEKGMRLQRWCLQDVAEELTQKRGYSIIVDFASGLPTNDHFHELVPEGTTIIYSDNDPLVVEYAHEILQDHPNVHFFLADAARPLDLLNRPEVASILGGRRDVALVHWGIAAFLSDEQVAGVARSLAEWATPETCWTFNAQAAGARADDPAMMEVLKIYKQFGTSFHLRSLEQYQTLVQPWQPDERGFISFLDWHGLDENVMSEEDLRVVSKSGGGYGAYLQLPKD